MIKVLNIITDTNLGGAGRVLINYLKYCDRSSFDVSAAVPAGSALTQRLRELGTEVYEVDGMRDKSYDRSVIKPLMELINETGPDIVHTHGSLSGRIAGRRCGKKVVYTRHSAFPVKGYMKHGPGRWLNKLINEHYADMIIAVGKAAADNLTDAGISPGRIRIIMNGSEPVRKVTDEERRTLRASYGFKDSDFVLGMMARIETYKGHDDAVDALRLLIDEGYAEKRGVKLIIAGEGSYAEELKRRCETLTESGYIVFAGFIDDVSRVLPVMDVQLNASYGTEVTSLALIEGMSTGLPSIVSDYGGNPMMVDDGANGLIYKTRDVKALAGCVKRIAEDAELYDKMRAGAERIYGERFTGEIFAAKTEEVYYTLKGEKA